MSTFDRVSDIAAQASWEETSTSCTMGRHGTVATRGKVGVGLWRPGLRPSGNILWMSEAQVEVADMSRRPSVDWWIGIEQPSLHSHRSRSPRPFSSIRRLRDAGRVPERQEPSPWCAHSEKDLD